MKKLYLTKVLDLGSSGSEGYMLLDSSESIDEIAQKAVLEYISLSDIEKTEEFVRETLQHYSVCKGCQNPQKTHELGIEIDKLDKLQFEKYGIKTCGLWHDGEIPIDAKVLCLDEHPSLKEIFIDFPILKPGEFLRNISWKDRKYQDFLESVFDEHSE